MNKFKLWYWVSNCGDGSVSVNFCNSEAEAEAAEQKDNEEYNEPWGESSVGSLVIAADGELAPRFLENRWVRDEPDSETNYNGKHVEVFHVLEKVEEKK